MIGKEKEMITETATLAKKKITALQDLVYSLANNMDMIQPEPMREIFENKLISYITQMEVNIKELSVHQGEAITVSRYLNHEWTMREIIHE